jgi:hypothetical protein
MIAWIQNLLDLIRLIMETPRPPKTPPEKPQEPATAQIPQDPLIQKRDMLKELCTYIRDYEGKPGDRNYRNNNPGNCRYSSVGYLVKYGHVGKDANGFAIFKDYATGFLYLENLIREKIAKHPTWTLLDLISNWAPAADHNNPNAYAQNVASRLRVEITYQIKNLLA